MIGIRNISRILTSSYDFDDFYLILITVMRFLIFLMASIRFAITAELYQPPAFQLWIITLSILLAHASIAYRGLEQKDRKKFAEARQWHNRRIWIDSTIFALLYILSEEPKSDLYLCFFVPLLVSAEYFDGRDAYIRFGIVTAFFGFAIISLFFITLEQNFSIEVIFRDVIPRWGFTLLIPYLALRRKASMSDSLKVLEAVEQTSRDIAEKRLLRDRLDAIMAAAIQLSGAEGCKVYLRKAKPDRLQLVALQGVDDVRFQVGYDLPNGKGMAWAVIGDQLPQKVYDYSQSMYRIPDLEDLFKAVMEVPLIIEKRAIGVLGVFNTRHPQNFTDRDQELLERLGKYAAVAIYGQLLVEEKDRQATVLASLSEASKAINTDLDRVRTLNAIVEQAYHLAIAHNEAEPIFACIGLLERTETLKLEAAYPWECFDEIKQYGDTISLNEMKHGIVGDAIRTGKSQLVGDVSQVDTYKEYNPVTRSQVAVPIRLGKEIIGVISIEHASLNAYTEELKDNMEILASHAAAAIENVEQLEARTELAVQGMAENTARHQITGNAIIIIRKVEDLLATESDQMFDPIPVVEDIGEIASLISNANRPISPPSIRNAILLPLNEWISSQYSQFEVLVGCHLEIVTELEDSAACWIAPGWLSKVCYILLTNSKRAMEFAPQQYMTITTRRRDKWADLIFTDTGSGIPAEIQLLLLSRNIRNSEGSGMGLLMADLIVKRYEGMIEIRKPGPGDTTIVISLPIKS